MINLNSTCSFDAIKEINESLYLSSNKDICGGDICIRGSRIMVRLIHHMYYVMGCSPDKILEAYPFLTQIEIMTALEYKPKQNLYDFCHGY